MKCAGFDPTRDQSRLAALIGKPCKPQNIQHLLDPDNGVEHSKYTLDLAMVLNCDPFWLGRNKGQKPVMRADQEVQYTPSHGNVALLAASPIARPFTWPFKSFSLEEFNEIDEVLRDNFEAIILASIRNRGHPQKKSTPASNTANG